MGIWSNEIIFEDFRSLSLFESILSVPSLSHQSLQFHCQPSRLSSHSCSEYIDTSNRHRVKHSLLILRICQAFVSPSCVIPGMCNADAEYQLINPTTQVALFSFCLDNCSTIKDIIWHIYQGTENESVDLIQWFRFNQNVSIFGQFSATTFSFPRRILF